MKKTIANIKQDKLIKLGLDVKDAYILSYIKELCSSDASFQKIINNKIFYHIDYENIADYLPALNINCLRTMGRRFSKYEKLGFITKHLHKDFNHKNRLLEGTFTYVFLEEKFQDLF